MLFWSKDQCYRALWPELAGSWRQLLLEKCPCASLLDRTTLLHSREFIQCFLASVSWPPGSILLVIDVSNSLQILTTFTAPFGARKGSGIDLSLPFKQMCLEEDFVAVCSPGPNALSKTMEDCICWITYFFILKQSFWDSMWLPKT